MVCYRFAAYATPLRTVPAWQPARFSRGDEDEPTQYLALHPLGPLAELMRNAELRSTEQVRVISTRTWALEVPIDDLPEITFANAERFGITAEQLVGDDYRPCQELAVRLRADVEGLIVPSAALPGTRHAVLFGPRVAAPYLTRPVSSLDIPASITADGARPPASLREVVRFPGDTHAALDAWRNGIDFRFAEPDWLI
ncbi:MAG: RES family NAD+ phosphorylase [Solirubrobacteraceae bacterium]